MVVLGAAQYAGQPSAAFRRRLDHALALYRAGGVQTIVVTGGRRPGDAHSEGEVGRSYLARRGVPHMALLAETRSRTTIENLRGAHTLLPPGTPLTLVTDMAHAPRALALAQALGLTVNASPSPLRRQPDWRYLIREKVALLVYSLLGVQGTGHANRVEDAAPAPRPRLAHP
ncbi:YdcF family protein [Deinococcus petrolearius]|uniref:YdcF family protein n=1 Tax=Deinococcus petrolearius TaxID=1751295 RepID=A0ABW1DLE3_9DEIO